VTRLGEKDLDGVVCVLANAFEGYPVMKHVLAESQDYPRDLATLLRFFANARFLRGEPVLGVALDGDPTGVALVSFPEHPSPPELAAYRTEVWDALGSGAERRYEAFGEATAPFFREIMRTHLNMIGVRRAAQGRGVGRALLESVADLATGRAGADGVTLTTEVPSNVELYSRFGYEVIGHARVAPELETWGMLKKSRP
jgi:GNAT superfamily N-acetyltransferase